MTDPFVGERQRVADALEDERVRQIDEWKSYASAGAVRAAVVGKGFRTAAQGRGLWPHETKSSGTKVAQAASKARTARGAIETALEPRGDKPATAAPMAAAVALRGMRASVLSPAAKSKGRMSIRPGTKVSSAAKKLATSQMQTAGKLSAGSGHRSVGTSDAKTSAMLLAGTRARAEKAVGAQRSTKQAGIPSSAIEGAKTARSIAKRPYLGAPPGTLTQEIGRAVKAAGSTAAGAVKAIGRGATSALSAANRAGGRAVGTFRRELGATIQKAKTGSLGLHDSDLGPPAQRGTSKISIGLDMTPGGYTPKMAPRKQAALAAAATKIQAAKIKNADYSPTEDVKSAAKAEGFDARAENRPSSSQKAARILRGLGNRSLAKDSLKAKLRQSPPSAGPAGFGKFSDEDLNNFRLVTHTPDIGKANKKRYPSVADVEIKKGKRGLIVSGPPEPELQQRAKNITHARTLARGMVADGMDVSREMAFLNPKRPSGKPIENSDR